MSITTSQIAACVSGVPTTFSNFVRSGELKGVKTESGSYSIQKEDLADFFIQHPSFWRRFLVTPQKKKYLHFREIMIKEVSRKTGRHGPLYYTLRELSDFFHIHIKSLHYMIKRGYLKASLKGTSYFVAEEELLKLITERTEYLDSLRKFKPKNRWESYLKDRLLFLYITERHGG